MESPGACIRRERELRGFSVQDVHRATRIPVKNLVALEADDYESLPQPAFVKGYIKACCKFMGLDETDLLLRYELYIKENAPPEKEPEAEKEPAPRAARPSALGSRNLVGVLLVIGLLIITGFYFLRERGPDDDLAKRRLVAAQEEAGSAGKAAGTAGDGSEGAGGGGAPAVIPAGPSGASPGAAGASTAPGAEHPLAERSSAEEAAAAPGHVLKVIATGDVWIKFSIDGKEPFEVLFHKGEDRHWLMKKGVSLIIGNAAGATIVFDGKPVKLPKEEGRVIRLSLPGSWKGTLKRPGRAKPGRGAGPEKRIGKRPGMRPEKRPEEGPGKEKTPGAAPGPEGRAEALKNPGTPSAARAQGRGPEALPENAAVSPAEERGQAPAPAAEAPAEKTPGRDAPAAAPPAAGPAPAPAPSHEGTLMNMPGAAPGRDDRRTGGQPGASQYGSQGGPDGMADDKTGLSPAVPGRAAPEAAQPAQAQDQGGADAESGGKKPPADDRQTPEEDPWADDFI